MVDMTSPGRVSCNYMHHGIRLVLVWSSCLVAAFLSPPAGPQHLHHQASISKISTFIRPVAAAGGIDSGAVLGSNEDSQGSHGVSIGKSLSAYSPSGPGQAGGPQSMNASAIPKAGRSRSSDILASGVSDPMTSKVSKLKNGTVETPNVAEKLVVKRDQKVRSAVTSQKRSIGGTRAGQADGEKSKTLSRVDRNKLINAETTAAEKVLTLVDFGLLGREDAVKYFETLSELERSSRQPGASSPAVSRDVSNGLLASMVSKIDEENPLSLIPFPAICGLLGISGMHSFHLSGHADTAAAVLGAVAGAGVGGLIVLGDDPLGRVTRSSSKTIALAVGSAGGWAGKEVSTSVASTIGGSATAARKSAVNASNALAEAAGSSVVGTLSALATSITAWPRGLARKAAQETQRALQRTSQAAAKVPVGLVRVATETVGKTLENTSRIALGAVKDSISAATSSPKETAARLRDVLQSSRSAVEAGTSSVKPTTETRVRQGREQSESPPVGTLRPSPMASQEKTYRNEASEEGEKGLDGEPGVAELDAKMSSVQNALMRFDAIKDRIEDASPSETSRAPVVAIPKPNTNGQERSDVPPSTSKKGSGNRGSSNVPEAIRGRSKRQANDIRLDENKRKRVAQALLDNAKQRAADAKPGLEVAAETIRPESFDRQTVSVRDESSNEARGTNGI